MSARAVPLPRLHIGSIRRRGGPAVEGIVGWGCASIPKLPPPRAAGKQKCAARGAYGEGPPGRNGPARRRRSLPDAHEGAPVAAPVLATVRHLVRLAGGVVVGAFAMAVMGSKAALATAAAPSTFNPTLKDIIAVISAHGPALAALVCASIFCSVCETSITTLWPWKVRELAASEGPGNPFELVRKDVSRYLTTILLISTFTNIAISALVTEVALAVLGPDSLGFVTLALTIFCLLFCEIMPKSAAVSHAVPLARVVVPPLNLFATVIGPVGQLCTLTSTLLLRLIGVTDLGEPFVTEDELKLVLSGAESSGAIEEEEQSMVQNVLDLDETPVRAVMTPLVDVIAVAKEAHLLDVRREWLENQVSRIPVFDGRIDNIVGIAYSMDLVNYDEAALGATLVEEVMQAPYVVPDSMTVWTLLRELRIRKVRRARA